MSYRVQITAVKPAGSQWFSEYNPDGHLAWQSWFKNLPGVVNVTKTKPNNNTIVRTYEFLDEAAYLNVKELSLTSPINLERVGYNELYGITSTTEILGA
jgi:hypothetical protein